MSAQLSDHVAAKEEAFIDRELKQAQLKMSSYSSPIPPAMPASTTSVSTLQFVSTLQPFSDLQNSLRNAGTQLSSHSPMSFINSPQKESSFTFQSLRPTSSEKAQSIIPLLSSSDRFCSVTAQRKLFQRFLHPKRDPLFGRPVGASSTTDGEQEAFLSPFSMHTTYSRNLFRRAAVNCAVVARTTPSTMDRWKSDEIKKYII